MTGSIAHTRFNGAFWLRIAIVNLFIVALLGTLMRYKIAFTFPYLDQKHLQHAHSHFAFIGWITHTIYVLMIDTLLGDQPGVRMRKYQRLLGMNLFSAYAMLISFAVQGYSGFSIAFLTLSVMVAFAFAFHFFRDIARGEDRVYKNWFVSALWFNIISSVGTFTLGYMMATHNFDQRIHLASLYYYLHFQYNGFFIFACTGLLLKYLEGHLPSAGRLKLIFWLAFSACIPACLLSALWLPLPVWVYALVVLAAVAQLVAWFLLLAGLRKTWLSLRASQPLVFYIILVVGVAVTAKLLLQLGSTIPAVSKLAFGFRQIIIAYLHLVLLAIVSVFLVAYLYLRGYLHKSRVTATSIVAFVVAVYLNELVLGIQGIAALSYTVIPYANEALFVVAVMILVTLALLVYSQRKPHEIVQ